MVFESVHLFGNHPACGQRTPVVVLLIGSILRFLGFDFPCWIVVVPPHCVALFGDGS